MNFLKHANFKNILIASSIAVGAFSFSNLTPYTYAYSLQTSMDLFLIICASSLRLFLKTHLVSVKFFLLVQAQIPTCHFSLSELIIHSYP